jgi:hypothetical protein
MIELDETKPPIPPLAPDSGDGGDRLAFFHLIMFLLACLDRMSTDSCGAPNTEYKWLEEWSDENYLYLETFFPVDSSEMEIDLNVSNGSIYARIARGTSGMRKSEPAAGRTDAFRPS